MKKLLFTLTATGVLTLGVAPQVQAGQAPLFDVVCLVPNGDTYTQMVDARGIHWAISSCRDGEGGTVLSISRVP